MCLCVLVFLSHGAMGVIVIFPGHAHWFHDSKHKHWLTAISCTIIYTCMCPCCHTAVSVLWLFQAVLWVGLWSVIVVFPGHILTLFGTLLSHMLESKAHGEPVQMRSVS